MGAYEVLMERVLKEAALNFLSVERSKHDDGGFLSLEVNMMDITREELRELEDWIRNHQEDITSHPLGMKPEV